MGEITFIETQADFEDFIKDGSAIIDFYADWCGPCKMISPKFVEMAKNFKSVKFGKVNVDEAEEVAQHCGISAMPTFIAYKNGEKFDTLTGASEAKLKELVEKLSAS